MEDALDMDADVLKDSKTSVADFIVDHKWVPPVVKLGFMTSNLLFEPNSSFSI